MRFSGNSVLPLVVLGLLAAFTFWLERFSRDDEATADAKLRHDPDFWVESFTLRRYAADGAIEHVLRAERLEHFPDDDSTEVTAPYLAYFLERKSVATAQRAWLDKGGENVQLFGDVRVIRLGQGGEPDTVVTTSRLHVRPKDGTADTDAPATLSRGRSVITGVGLQVDDKAQTAVLSGPVQGIIYRKSP